MHNKYDTPLYKFEKSSSLKFFSCNKILGDKYSGSNSQTSISERIFIVSSELQQIKCFKISIK